MNNYVIRGVRCVVLSEGCEILKRSLLHGVSYAKTVQDDRTEVQILTIENKTILRQLYRMTTIILRRSRRMRWSNVQYALTK
jgi:hypothetical protein